MNANNSGNFSRDTITLGNGVGDTVNANNSSNTIITLGNGDNDTVNGSGNGNIITLGNGNNDAVTLHFSAGGDTIITGKGLDTVTVDTHTNPDTFGFAKGTDGTSFTTITGAQAGDHVISGNNLGNNVINSATTATTLADFIASLSGNPNGNTYVGYNTTANDTFIVSNHGAVELVGVAFMNSSALNHVLTLA